jgi:hypothetical protein
MAVETLAFPGKDVLAQEIDVNSCYVTPNTVPKKII